MSLSEKINTVLSEEDENLNYTEFADAVSDILKSEYGKHNFKSFVNRLSENLEL